jgi:hypothetical protein
VEARLVTLDALTEPSTLVIHVLLKRAAVALRRQRLSDAQALLHQISQRFPQGAHVGEVRYLQALVRSRQGGRARLDHRSHPCLPWVPTVFARLTGMLRCDRPRRQARRL